MPQLGRGAGGRDFRTYSHSAPAHGSPASSSMEPLQWLSPRAPVTVAKCNGKLPLSFLTLADLSAAFTTGSLCGPMAFEFSSISSGCSFCPPSDFPALCHLLRLVWLGILCWVLFSSHSVPTLGWSHTFPWLQQPSAGGQLLSLYLSSLLLSFLSQTCSCHHPLDINVS